MAYCPSLMHKHLPELHCFMQVRCELYLVCNCSGLFTFPAQLITNHPTGCNISSGGASRHQHSTSSYTGTRKNSVTGLFVLILSRSQGRGLCIGHEFKTLHIGVQLPAWRSTVHLRPHPLRVNNTVPSIIICLVIFTFPIFYIFPSDNSCQCTLCTVYLGKDILMLSGVGACWHSG